MDMLTNKRAAPGNVLTTIDKDVQKAAYDALQGKQGAAVAMDPVTGEILAVVNNPSFDPGSIAGADDEQRPGRRSPPTRARPWRTPPCASRRRPAPPSSWSPSRRRSRTASSRTSTRRPAIPDPYTIPGTRTKLPSEAGSAACNNVSVRTALKLSCNNVFAELASKLGQDKMRATAEKLGFNVQIDTPVRTNPPSKYPSKKMSVDQVAQTGIGQFDVQATPLQMAMVTAAIENGGKLVSPHLVSEVTDSDGNVLESFKDPKSQQVMSEKTASMIQDAMRTVATEGGGKTAQVPGAEVGRQDRYRPARRQQQPAAAGLVHHVRKDERQADRGRRRDRELGHRPLRDRRRQAGRPHRAEDDAGLAEEVARAAPGPGNRGVPGAFPFP